ncbi:MAG: hypothetical protein QOD83_263 [Solirubrobacteraceae bacterium]|jgi:hypothetical protein|nr:hypothetical protein [Solirubrobacteraceae bacterium]
MLSNYADQAKICAALPDSVAGLAAVLPSLRTGEALISGETLAMLHARSSIRPIRGPRRKTRRWHPGGSIRPYLSLLRRLLPGEAPMIPRRDRWTPGDGSGRIVAEAYMAETETILVRFPNGKEWADSACPPAAWHEFTAPGQSRGEYIARVLDAKPNGQWSG